MCKADKSVTISYAVLELGVSNRNNNITITVMALHLSFSNTHAVYHTKVSKKKKK